MEKAENMQASSCTELILEQKTRIQEAKKNFLRELTLRDPQWRDKILQKKQREIKMMEEMKLKLKQDMEERQKALT